MRSNAVQRLLFFIYLATSTLCLGMHIPVALLFEQKEENALESDSAPVDPMIAELAIHIDQQYAPVVASRQLVHRLMRHQAQFIAAQKDRSTKLGTLMKYIMRYTQTKNSQPSFAHTYSLRNLEPESPSQQFTQTELKYGNKIVQFLEKHPNLVSYIFITQIPVSAWKAYQVSSNKNPNNSPPLYVLMPPSSTALSTQAAKSGSYSLKEIPMDAVMRTAVAESPDTQRADYQALSARSILSCLEVLRAHLGGTGTASASKLMLSVGGHGRYTRSQYGILADRTKPTDFTALPQPAQYTLEAKDSASAIAGLPVPTFIKLLSFLDAKKNTDLVYYDSCHTGNQHLVLPYLNKAGTPRALSFHAATRGIDGGLSSHDHFKMSFDQTKPTLSIRCPMDPKKFFERMSAWCELPQETQQADKLKSAFLAIIGNRQRNNVMFRPASTAEFAPLVTRKSLCITPEMLQESKQPIMLKKNKGQIFLRHNMVDRSITGTMPKIRSAIPTNSIHYIKAMAYTDPNNGSMLDMLSHIFFHEHNQAAINRMAFFVKTLMLTTQNKTHILYDVLVLHQTYWQNQKSSFVVWRNPRRIPMVTPTYNVAWAPQSQGLLKENVEDMTPLTAHVTMLYYLGLGTKEQSYIEAPPLEVALPQAFDDSKVREHCAQAYANNECNEKMITKIWHLLKL